MALKALFLSVFLSMVQLVPNPEHCYDFISNTVNDGCGSENLTRVGKLSNYTQLGITQLRDVIAPVAHFKVELTSTEHFQAG